MESNSNGRYGDDGEAGGASGGLEKPKMPQLSLTTASTARSNGDDRTNNRDDAAPRSAAIQPAGGKEVPTQAEPLPDEALDVRDVVDEFASGTSIHGVSYVFDREHFRKWKRIVWGVLVLVGLCLTIWQIDVLINQYLKYDVVTSVRTVVNSSLPFPAVTVCNINRYYSGLLDDAGLKDPHNEEELQSVSANLTDFIIEDPHFLFNSLPRDSLIEFWRPVITDYGKCFEFQTDERVYEPGYRGGLQFTAFINQAQYENRTSEAGVLVFVHQRGIRISQQSPSITAAPGLESRIVFDASKHTRERAFPWSECQFQAPEYTQDQCLSECISKILSSRCGCRLTGDPNRDFPYCERISPEDSSNNAEVSSSNNADSDCGFRASDIEVFDAECVDNCTKPPCEEELFPASVSSLAQSENTKIGVADWLSKQSELNDESFDALYEFYEQNFVNVHVNFERLRVEEITETKAMSFTQLLANIGGQLGLFLGISLISIMELVGELCAMRLVPRLWGDRRLYGVGSTRSKTV